MAEGNGGITFTTKEMLTSLDLKIDRIESKLDRKVDRDTFEKVQVRLEQLADRAAVATLDARLSALEHQIRLQDSVNAALAQKAQETAEKSAQNFTRREKVLGAIVGLVALAIQIYVVWKV